MTTQKRTLPFKDLVVEPLNWVAPQSTQQDPPSQLQKQESTKAEYSTES